MGQLKLNESFYPYTFTVFEVLKEADLTAAEWRIWSFLSINESWGARYEDTDALTVMSRCNVSQATYFRAIAKFKEFNLFEIQDKGISYKNNFGISQLREINSDNSAIKTENNPTLKNDNPTLKNDNPTLKNDNGFSGMIVNSQVCESQNLQASSDKGSGSPKISKKDQIKKTLSDQTEVEACEVTEESQKERERERFLKNKISTQEAQRSVSQEISQGKVHRDSAENSEVIPTKTERSQPHSENANRSTATQPRNQKPQPVLQKNAANDRAKPINPASENQKDAACSTPEMSARQWLISCQIPLYSRVLRDKYEFTKEEVLKFQSFAQKKVANFSPPIQVLDSWLNKHGEPIVAEFLHNQAEAEKRKGNSMEERRKQFEEFYKQYLIDKNLERNYPSYEEAKKAFKALKNR